MIPVKLSAAMRAAIETAYDDGTIRESEHGITRSTVRALVVRGLAEARYGTAYRTNRYSRTAQRVYGVYLGARLTDEGKALRAARKEP